MDRSTGNSSSILLQQTGRQAVAGKPLEPWTECSSRHGDSTTHRFNDVESGCHLSSALMATPGTENKQTDQMVILYAVSG